MQSVAKWIICIYFSQNNSQAECDSGFKTMELGEEHKSVNAKIKVSIMLIIWFPYRIK